jgi:hypothetical protein
MELLFFRAVILGARARNGSLGYHRIKQSANDQFVLEPGNFILGMDKFIPVCKCIRIDFGRNGREVNSWVYFLLTRRINGSYFLIGVYIIPTEDD